MTNDEQKVSLKRAASSPAPEEPGSRRLRRLSPEPDPTQPPADGRSPYESLPTELRLKIVQNLVPSSDDPSLAHFESIARTSQGDRALAYEVRSAIPRNMAAAIYDVAFSDATAREESNSVTRENSERGSTTGEEGHAGDSQKLVGLKAFMQQFGHLTFYLDNGRKKRLVEDYASLSDGGQFSSFSYMSAYKDNFNKDLTDVLGVVVDKAISRIEAVEYDSEVSDVNPAINTIRYATTDGFLNDRQVDKLNSLEKSYELAARKYALPRREYDADRLEEGGVNPELEEFYDFMEFNDPFRLTDLEYSTDDEPEATIESGSVTSSSEEIERTTRERSTRESSLASSNESHSRIAEELGSGSVTSSSEELERTTRERSTRESSLEASSLERMRRTAEERSTRESSLESSNESRSGIAEERGSPFSESDWSDEEGYLGGESSRESSEELPAPDERGQTGAASLSPSPASWRGSDSIRHGAGASGEWSSAESEFESDVSDRSLRYREFSDQSRSPESDEQIELASRGGSARQYVAFVYELIERARGTSDMSLRFQILEAAAERIEPARRAVEREFPVLNPKPDLSAAADGPSTSSISSSRSQSLSPRGAMVEARSSDRSRGRTRG